MATPLVYDSTLLHHSEPSVAGNRRFTRLRCPLLVPPMQQFDRLRSAQQASCSNRLSHLCTRATATEAMPLPASVPADGKATSPFMQAWGCWNLDKCPVKGQHVLTLHSHKSPVPGGRGQTLPGDKERMDFLREDLGHLFDDQGLKKDEYDSVVEFRDPITKYNSISGYMFNIAMLKQVFAPNFELHDIRQTGEFEITTRWTMTMQFTLNRISPLRRFWDPKLIFSGVSIMGINPDNGKVNRHIDLWDAVRNNKWFSWEAASHVGGQMISLMRQPDLESFSYTILRKTKDYEIRSFKPFNVIEAKVEQPSSSAGGRSGQWDPAGQATGAFRALAGFLFGKNKKQQKFAMTMPVVTTTMGTMQFILPSNVDPKTMPEPLSNEVKASQQPGGIWAARPFSGVADTARSQQEAEKLQQALLRDKLKPGSDQWALARYNDPSTKPWFRRNEVLLPVENFQLWGN